MNKGHLTCLCVIMFAVCFRTAHAINCYQCSSVENSMCLEPNEYDKESIERFLKPEKCTGGEDSGKEFFCRKITQTILRKGHEPEVRISRGCGWVRHHKECYKMDNEDHLETVCQCFDNECNGAVSRTVSYMTVTTTIITMWLGFKRFI